MYTPKHSEPIIKTFATKCLIIMAVFLLIFTVAMIVVFCNHEQVPDTLITCVFSVCGAETIGLLIKKILKKESKSDDDE